MNNWENVVSEKYAERITELEKAGYKVEYDENIKLVKVFTNKKKNEFLVLSDDLMNVREDRFFNDVASFYFVDSVKPQKVITRFKYLSHNNGRLFKRDEDAESNLPKNQVLTGGMEQLLLDRNKANIIKILDPESDIADKALKIHDRLISNGLLELPPIIEYDMEKKKLVGETDCIYTSYATVSLLSRVYGDARVKYTLYPYAISDKKAGDVEISAIGDPNSEHTAVYSAIAEIMNIMEK